MRKIVSGLGFYISCALLIGLCVPVVIALTVLTHVREKQIGIEIQNLVEAKVQTMQHNLVLPIWNMDKAGIQAIVQSAMLDEQVVAVEVRTPDGKVMAASEEASRRRGTLFTKSADLLSPQSHRNMTIGSLSVLVSDQQMQLKLRADKIFYSLVLLCQAAVSLVMIGWVVYWRVLAPLQKLTMAAESIRSGQFDSQIAVQQVDEIGVLARRMALMQASLKALFEEQAAILNNIPAGVLFTRNSRIEFINRAGETIFGAKNDELTGQTCERILLAPPPGAKPHHAPDAGPGSTEVISLRRLDGSRFPAELRTTSMGDSPLSEQRLWVVIDVSDRVAAEREIDRLAFYDPVTQLPNRNLLMDRLRQSMANQVAIGEITVLFCLEIYNAELAHGSLEPDKVDELHAHCARRLSAQLESHQTMARVGGEKFSLISSLKIGAPAEGVKYCESLAQHFIDSLAPRQPLTDLSSTCSVSVGINIIDTACATAEEAMMQAEMAMVQARTAGRNTFRFFNPSMQRLANQRTVIEAELRQAIVEKQLVVFYQPQVTFDGEVVGAEALVRWRHPQRGLLSPAHFIQVAEDAGLMGAMGQLVLKAVCVDLDHWQAAGLLNELVVSVNVSAQEFKSNDFVACFCHVLAQHHAANHHVKVELTESMMVDNIDDVITKMHALKAHHVTISLDDFGTGYSSLSYLGRFPIDQIKIDQSFVRDMLLDGAKASITRTIIMLGESLGLSIIAEGVETEDQRNMLRAQGCSLYQGYWYSKPIAAEDFVGLLERTRVPMNQEKPLIS